MSKSKKIAVISDTSTAVKNQNSLDYSKAEQEFKRITIPNSAFEGAWCKDKGYSIGYENIRITRDYETLDEALNQIGYGVKTDEEGDEVLEKYGHVNFEIIVNIVRAINYVTEQNTKQWLEELLKKSAETV